MTDLKIGKRIEGRWEVNNVLRGGMGIVYVVYDHKTREPLAAKTFQDEIFIRNPVVADLFTGEALAWINLDAHQNVARARFVQRFEGKPYLFLEHIAGGDLSRWVGTPRLTEDLPQVLRFAIQFCDGMTHALSKGVEAHRDIKPRNCLVTPNRVLKVADFGLAKVLDAGGQRVGRGTHAYMPPEQWDDFEAADVRSDIYSFGVMLFQMITGVLPFTGKTPEELEHLHKTQPPPPLAAGDDALRAIVNDCLAKNPGRRHASFGAVREGLAEVYERLAREPAPRPAAGEELEVAAQVNKGLSLYELGRYEDAVAWCDRALETNRRLEEAWNNKGIALAAQGRHEEAVSCYDQALGINPRAQMALSNKGVALYELGRNDEALDHLDRALKIEPLDSKAWSNKGIVLEKLGQRKEAMDCHDRAIALDPRNEQVWTNKGLLLAAQGWHKEAVACHDIALGINRRLDVAWHNKGGSLAALGRHKEAVECLDQALKINPRRAMTWAKKGLTLAEMGQLKEAFESYFQAVSLNPQDEKSWNNMGQILDATGQPDRAVFCYSCALKINPLQDMAWSNMGGSLVALGQNEEAIECCDRAIAINPRQDFAWCNKAAALHALRRHKEAVDCCDRALEINRGLAKAWYNKGVALFVGSQSYGEALKCFEEALRLGIPQAAGLIARCRRMLGQQ